MNWATSAIEKLKLGHQTTIYPKGNSMLPLVISGAKVTLEPITDNTALQIGDIVLVYMGRSVYLHLITATSSMGSKFIKDYRYQISNNKGSINGWANKEHIYGRAINIENKCQHSPNGKRQSPQK